MTVRPFFRKLFGFAIALLTVYVAWLSWDYVEARRLRAAVEDVRARGLYVDPPPGFPRIPEYADDVERFYQAAGDLILSSPVNELLGRALRDADVPLAPQHVAEGRRILAENLLAFQLMTRAKAAPIHQWRNLYGRQAWALSLGRVQMLGSFRTRFLARTKQVDDAARSLVDSFDIRRAVEGLDSNEYDYYPRFRTLSLALAGAFELEVILNEGRPSPELLARLKSAFALDPSSEMTFEQWQLGTMMTDLRAGRTGEVYRISSFMRIDVGPSMTRLVDPFMRHEITGALRNLADIVDATRQPWPARLSRLQALAHEEDPRGERRPYSILNPRHFSTAFETEQLLAQAVAAGRCAQVAVAIEEFRDAQGHAPESLSQLVPVYLDSVPIDPFDGRPMRYKVTADSYTVYSVDRNGKDDGGNFGRGWKPGLHVTFRDTPDNGIRVRLRSAKSG